MSFYEFSGYVLYLLDALDLLKPLQYILAFLVVVLTVKIVAKLAD